MTVDDPYRFRKNRDADAYFGLRPRRRESGDSRHSYGLPKKVMPTWENDFCCAHTTFWVPFARTVIYGAGGWNWPHGRQERQEAGTRGGSAKTDRALA